MPGLMWRTLRRDMRSSTSRSSSFAPTAVPLPRHLPGRSGVTRACGPTACAEHHHAVLGDQASGSRWARYSGQAGRQTGRQTGRQAGWLEYYKLGYPRLDRRPMTWQEKGKQGRGTRGWEVVGACTSCPTPLFSAPPHNRVHLKRGHGERPTLRRRWTTAGALRPPLGVGGSMHAPCKAVGSPGSSRDRHH